MSSFEIKIKAAHLFNQLILRQTFEGVCVSAMRVSALLIPLSPPRAGSRKLFFLGGDKKMLSLRQITRLSETRLHRVKRCYSAQEADLRQAVTKCSHSQL